MLEQAVDFGGAEPGVLLGAAVPLVADWVAPYD
jgi:hypothetical protein